MVTFLSIILAVCAIVCAAAFLYLVGWYIYHDYHDRLDEALYEAELEAEYQLDRIEESMFEDLFALYAEGATPDDIYALIEERVEFMRLVDTYHD